jgi:hypothetical protein
MLSLGESVWIVILCLIVTAVILVVLRRVWPPYLRRQHNDLIGWQLTVLGTIYAVIIGFMLYTVWTNFVSAEVNAEMEANCLVQVVRLAEDLPPAQRQRVQELARDYAQAMIDKEWPAMSHERFSTAGIQIARELWKTVELTQTNTRSEQTAVSHALSQLDSMLEHRRIRQLQSQSSLPAVLWIVLIVGGVITVASSFLFGADSFMLHTAQSLALTLMISLALVAIADVNRPFQGWMHVSSSGFSFALERIQALSSMAP